MHPPLQPVAHCMGISKMEMFKHIPLYQKTGSLSDMYVCKNSICRACQAADVV